MNPEKELLWGLWVYTTMMELGPQNHNRDGLLGPRFHHSSVYGPYGVLHLRQPAAPSSTL